MSPQKLTVADFNRCRFLSVIGLQTDMRYGGNRRQRLSPKAHRMDIPQIIFIFHLAGRMTFKSRCGILCIHSLAVINDRNALDASLYDMDRNASGIGINAVFD